MSEQSFDFARQYDVALSFAGEDRQYVRSVADGLQKAGVRVFYDDYEKANLWGKDLYAHLSSVYRERSRYTIMFVSEHYARKLWTNHERKSAQEKAFTESREYILPVLFDDTEIPGILSTVGYVDARSTSPEDLIILILDKLQERMDGGVVSPPLSLTPLAVIRIRDTLWPVFERIEQIQSGEVPGVSSGIPSLDQMTGGWREESLTIVTGDPVLARDFAFHCAFHAATLDNIPALVHSYRETPFALAERALAWGSGVSVRLTRKPGMKDDLYPRIAMAGGIINTAPLSFVELAPVASSWTSTLRETIRDMVNFECRLLVLDGWGNSSPESVEEDDLHALRTLAVECALSVILALPTQRHRRGESLSPDPSGVADALIRVDDSGERMPRARDMKRIEMRITQGNYEDEIASRLAADERGFFFEVAAYADENWPRGAFDTQVSRRKHGGS
jgi:hypothetical protein